MQFIITVQRSANSEPRRRHEKAATLALERTADTQRQRIVELSDNDLQAGRQAPAGQSDRNR
jgi:hypothetical protein